MITFLDSKEKTNTNDTERCLDSQLWHACAGSMVQMPPVNSKVFYFPQGHAEHSTANVEFSNCPRIPSCVPSRILAVKFMAHPETDEVYARIKLVPVSNNDVDCEDEGINGMDPQDRPSSFAKTLTQSDANNGGGFSVPRYCAETIFPRLDFSADPPVQTILAKDVHGEVWKFRHIYRGTPRRHLLTTGWSTFVNQKKLVAGDSIVFLRAENGDLCVGIRRAKRAIDSSSGWNSAYGGGFSPYLREDENKLLRNNCNGGGGGGDSESKGKVSAESVVEAATLAANGQPFEVVYYPRASTPEFCVKASLVKAAMQIRWCSGMRFKMPFETEDSSRISWFMGTISSVQVADPVRWPDSPWRLLQVTWDEPDLLQNVKHVSPWLVELVSNMPTAIHLSPFSPPRKKMRLPQHPDFFLDSQFPVPAFTGNILGRNSPFSSCLPDNAPAGMQGARHAQNSLSLSDIHFNKLQSTLFSAAHFPPFDNSFLPIRPSDRRTSEDISCLLTVGNSNQTAKGPEIAKPTQLVLFGQPILTEQQMSGETVSPVGGTGNSSSEGNGGDKVANKSDGSEGLLHWYKNNHRQQAEASLETGHCKVFMESEDVGRTLDLSTLGSYEELYRKLANMFGVGCSEMLNHVLYRDGTGSVKPIGDESFSEFMKTAKRLTILADSSSNTVEM